MSLAAIAALVTGARPFHLYLFQRGDVQYQYASTAQAITRTIAGAEDVAFLADHGKLGRKAPFFFAKVTDLSCVITDAQADVEFLEELRDHGVEVLTAG